MRAFATHAGADVLCAIVFVVTIQEAGAAVGRFLSRTELSFIELSTGSQFACFKRDLVEAILVVFAWDERFALAFAFAFTLTFAGGVIGCISAPIRFRV